MPARQCSRICAVAAKAAPRSRRDKPVRSRSCGGMHDEVLDLHHHPALRDATRPGSRRPSRAGGSRRGDGLPRGVDRRAPLRAVRCRRPSEPDPGRRRPRGPHHADPHRSNGEYRGVVASDPAGRGHRNPRQPEQGARRGGVRARHPALRGAAIPPARGTPARIAKTASCSSKRSSAYGGSGPRSTLRTMAPTTPFRPPAPSSATPCIRRIRDGRTAIR